MTGTNTLNFQFNVAMSNHELFIEKRLRSMHRMHEARFDIEPMCTAMPNCHLLPSWSGTRPDYAPCPGSSSRAKQPSRWHRQALLGQLPIDDLENPERQFVGFEFVLKLEQICGARSLLTPKVDAAEDDREAVVGGILDTLIGKT